MISLKETLFDIRMADPGWFSWTKTKNQTFPNIGRENFEVCSTIDYEQSFIFLRDRVGERKARGTEANCAYWGCFQN